MQKIQSVRTAVTSTVFLATEKPSHRICINVPYSVPFTLDLFNSGFRVRVIGLVVGSGSMLVLFFCIFSLSHVG